MRLIDADSLMDRSGWYNLAYGKTFHGVWDYEIASEPTVDAVPVVRCKDCTYFSNAKLNAKGFLVCPASGMEITEDDYCSYGERKEDNT